MRVRRRLIEAGHVYIVSSVPLLHPEAQTVEEMLEGWRIQQLCRNLDHETIAGRVRTVGDVQVERI
jgi:integrase/recombinase XerD